MRQFKNILILVVAMIVTVMIFQGRAHAAEYTVPEGTVYWESSYGGGTGRHATVSDENACTRGIEEEGLFVKVDGYSILNNDGNILESDFSNGTEMGDIPENQSGTRMMLHIWSMNGYRLGWIDAQDIKNMKSPMAIREVPDGDEEEWLEEVEPKDADEIVDILQEALKEDESIPRKSYVLGDFSGSMSSFHSDVMSKLENFVGEKYVFAGKVQKFSSGMDVYDYDINQGSTDIANAFNALSEVETDAHIYLLSDLQDNAGTAMKQNDDFVGEITIVYYPGYAYAFYSFIGKLRKAFPNATLTGF